MVNLRPTKCNICNGDVIYTSNEIIYGKKYGSGMCYFCTKCGAYVGTHEPRPDEAFGLLADSEMRNMKMKCHDIFDRKWKDKPTLKERRTARKAAYLELAGLLGIPVEDCHFGYFDIEMLNRVYTLLSK